MIKILCILALLYKGLYGYINIYPSFFYKELSEKGVNETFFLTNRLDRPLRYRVYFETEDVKAEEFIKIEAYPKSLTLLPGESKPLKLEMIPKTGLKKGVYKYKMVVKEIKIPKVENNSVLTEFKLNLLTYYGDIPIELECSVEKKREKYILNLKNIGKRLGVFKIYLNDTNGSKIFVDRVLIKENEKIKKEIELQDKKEIEVRGESEELYFKYMTNKKK